MFVTTQFLKKKFGNTQGKDQDLPSGDLKMEDEAAHHYQGPPHPQKC